MKRTFQLASSVSAAWLLAVLATTLAIADPPRHAPLAQPLAPVRVILVGDSTMATSSGYGDTLCSRLRTEVTCLNLAKGGRSSKSYRAEGSWDKVLEVLAQTTPYTANYVLLQFGHNDQPGKAERSTTLPEFEANMTRYVNEVRAAGATPVLVTPLTRRQFTDGKLLDNLGPWADITRKVAGETHTPVLDLHQDSMAEVQRLGPVAACELAMAPPPPEVAAAAATGTTTEVHKAVTLPTTNARITPSFDYTHVGPHGAEVFSGVVAHEIAATLPALAPYLLPRPSAASAASVLERDLWPGVPPGGDAVRATESEIERSPNPAEQRDRALIGITKPRLTVYRPAHPNGAAVLILPGGSYLRVVVDKEGEIGRLLNASGITAAVLAYRLPVDGWTAGRDAPLQDAQRAIRLIRSGELGAVDPKRVGVLGFSAGGDLAAALTLRFSAETYPLLNDIDRLSARPDFTVLIYPAINMPVQLASGAAQPPQVDLYSAVTSAAPPFFLVHAADDPAVPVDRTLKMFATLQAAKVPVEMHIFEEGGHGFGVRGAAGKPVAAWPELLVRWGERRQIFTHPPQDAAGTAPPPAGPVEPQRR